MRLLSLFGPKSLLSRYPECTGNNRKSVDGPNSFLIEFIRRERRFLQLSDSNCSGLGVTTQCGTLSGNIGECPFYAAIYD